MASPETLELPRSDFWFSFPAATYFLAIYLQEYGVRSRLQLLDKFEYAHYLFAGWCVGVKGRSY